MRESASELDKDITGKRAAVLVELWITLNFYIVKSRKDFHSASKSSTLT